jgi:hypothetical protein
MRWSVIPPPGWREPHVTSPFNSYQTAEDLIRGARGNRRGELRSPNESCHWVCVRRTPGGVVTNTYYVPAVALSEEEASVIERLGWFRVAEREGLHPGGVTHRRCWPARTLIAEIADSALSVAHEGLGFTEAREEMFSTRRNWAFLEEPPFPHAIAFWDYKSEVPFWELTEAANRLLATGARQLHFNEALTQSDTVAVVMAPVPLSYEAASDLWYLSVAEMPDGGELVTWGC